MEEVKKLYEDTVPPSSTSVGRGGRGGERLVSPTGKKFKQQSESSDIQALLNLPTVD